MGNAERHRRVLRFVNHRRGRITALACVAAVSAACSSPAGNPTGAAPPTSASSARPYPSGSIPAPSAITTTGSGRAGGSERPGSTSASPSGAASGGSAAAGATGPVGAFARTLLQTGRATNIAIQVIEESGASPDQPALDEVATKLRQISEKNVALTGPVVFTGGPSAWTPSDLASVVDRDGTANSAGTGTAVLHLLFVHGQFDNDPSVLGVAFRGDALAIFPDQTSGSLTLDTDRIATSIYLHETGHLLGLVDEVLHDGRGDPNDPSHCMCHSPDRNSVMYYAIDTTAIGQLLGGAPPTDFDAADYGDLAKIRAGA